MSSTNSASKSASDSSSTDVIDRLVSVRKHLMKVSLLPTTTALSEEQRATVCEELLWLSEQSEYQTLGICADDLGAATAALKSYVSALGKLAQGQPIQVDIPPREGVVFLKFNTLKKAWYLDSYSGESRGVLVTYHTSETGLDDVNGTYGPFPLDLFE